jgi:hypothetical protein
VASSVLLQNESVATFILGLSSFKLHRETRDNSWAAMGHEYIKTMELWATQGSEHNFLHRLQLLKAEEYHSYNNVQKAEMEYLKAIESSRRSKFTNDEAFCCESADLFFFKNGDVESSLAHFMLAHRCYETWGALNKAEKLDAFMRGHFKDVVINGDVGPAANFNPPHPNPRKRESEN